jgi:hypothetical protein
MTSLRRLYLKLSGNQDPSQGKFQAASSDIQIGETLTGILGLKLVEWGVYSSAVSPGNPVPRNMVLEINHPGIHFRTLSNDATLISKEVLILDQGSIRSDADGISATVSYEHNPRVLWEGPKGKSFNQFKIRLSNDDGYAFDSALLHLELWVEDDLQLDRKMDRK